MKPPARAAVSVPATVGLVHEDTGAVALIVNCPSVLARVTDDRMRIVFASLPMAQGLRARPLSTDRRSVASTTVTLSSPAQSAGRRSATAWSRSMRTLRWE